jgi:hypothetical protein
VEKNSAVADPIEAIKPLWLRAGRWPRCYLRRGLDMPVAGAHLSFARPVFGTIFSAGAEGIGDMRQLGSMLRATPARIGRRLAQIVAIAAASLPVAGA